MQADRHAERQRRDRDGRKRDGAGAGGRGLGILRTPERPRRTASPSTALDGVASGNSTSDASATHSKVESEQVEETSTAWSPIVPVTWKA